ncbi:S26 family signal peptidase [Motilimonas eburnea]|uniref:S26 family signal peptidase n=1 Tax=Motilimonas eburnea TaxID=1737488 RepID=UPI001E47CD62|nr:S26 family signal peptidase [Motilimonas eburnea]MCE2572813.1 S26 family signal peptidase [Motilimonas eburnea]
MSKTNLSPLILGVFIPGSALLFTHKPMRVMWPLVMALLWVATLAISRWVLEPIGFTLLLVGLFGIHLLSYVAALILFRRDGQASVSLKRYIALLMSTLLYCGVAYLCHTYKAQWFGFAFYHIPSASMTPTLQVGDVVVVDTWSNQANTITTGDVIVLKRSASDLVLAKRLKEKRNNNGQWELYLAGDNPSGSVDSRQFGWVTSDYIIGKISFVWFSFENRHRLLLSLEPIPLNEK